MLRQTKTYYDSSVIRTRDMSVLDAECDIVIDVGGTYDHFKLRYDHHQRGFEERWKKPPSSDANESYSVSKLSASGLIYRHYGRDVILELCPHLDADSIDIVYEKMYDGFMEAIDAIDTGVEIAAETAFSDATGLSSRVSRLNPRWNEDTDNAAVDQRFEVASAMCGEDFTSVLERLVYGSLPARKFVEEALLGRFDVDPSGEIMAFRAGGMPWKSHLYELEKKHGIGIDGGGGDAGPSVPLVKFVLYQDQSGMWRVQAVTVEGTAFTNRLGLPELWRGLRDDELSKVSGIEGCTFCHAAGFIGGNKSKEGAVMMARTALKAPETTVNSQRNTVSKHA
mmetsp:Transcript_27991/g.64081  ORF Transcript_27991/g.64081 Transcript_27991/m.64081 type:complete len:338 (-) Transcript_27991:618-1631(-)